MTVREFWREMKRLKWAIFAAIFPIVVLDLLDIRFDFTTSMRWVPTLQRMGNVAMALVFAHICWKAMFARRHDGRPYLDLGELLDAARRPEAGVKEAIVFAAVAMLRLGVLAAIIVGWAFSQ